MIEQRLENGKVAKILVAQAVFQFTNLFRNIRLALEALHHGLADFPIKIFDLGFLRQIHHPQSKHVLGIFLSFERVVIRFQLVQLGQVLLDIQ